MNNSVENIHSGAAPVPAPDQSLSGKHAVITGAAGSIGRAIAERFDRAGVNMTLIDIQPDGFGYVENLRSSAHQQIVLDLRSKSRITEFCEKQLASTGVDILVNSVGILNSEKCLESTRKQWRQIMAVNVESILLLTQAVVPAMLAKRWGRLINLGSLASKTGGITAGTSYSASKAAVVGLTKSFAREFAPYGVTANVISPAYVMSPMVSEQLTDDERLSVLKRIPVGRFCDPAEVAHVAAFLADDLAGFITGEVIDVTGGLSMG